MTITLERDMEIRFCDLCQESIPDADFESGKAVKLDARTVCVACALKRSLSLSGPRSWLTLLLALYAAGATSWLLVQRRSAPGVAPAVSAAIAEQRRESAEAAGRQADAAAAAVRGELVRQGEETQRGFTRLGGDLKALSDRQEAERSATLESVGELRTGFKALREQAERVNAWLLELKARAAVEGPEPTVAPAPAPATPPAPGPAPVEPPVAPAPAPAPAPATPPKQPAGQAPDAVLQRLLDLLADPDPGVAFSATIDLGKLRDLRAVPPLVNALRKHRDFYVRLGAADALRELKACDAVEHLIDALTDKDDLVRSSVNVALQGITQHEEPFAPNLPSAELRRVQTAWRKWWKESETLVRGRLGQPKP